MNLEKQKHATSSEYYKFKNKKKKPKKEGGRFL